jgi:hypothetical protein
MIKKLFITMGNVYTSETLTITPVDVLNIYSFKGLYFFTHKVKHNKKYVVMSELSTGMRCNNEITNEIEAIERLSIALKNNLCLSEVIKKFLIKLKESGLKKIPVNVLTNEIKKYAEEIEF